MMKRYLYLTFIAILLLQARINGQTITYPAPNDSTIIQIKEFYEGYGKIFDKRSIGKPDFDRFLKMNKWSLKLINLSDGDLILAEQIFFKQYDNLQRKDERYYPFNKPIRNVQKKFKDYYRQYQCFENEQGEKCVRIHLLNFKDNELANKYFEGWQNEPMYGSGGFYDSNQRRVLINLSLRKCIIP